MAGIEGIFHGGFDMERMIKFKGGATRSADDGKLDFEGFLSPIVLERYACYMQKHRKQADGKMRESDNWQNGMCKNRYMKSMFRHFFDVWKVHRGVMAGDMEDALCALLFNVMGYLFEILKKKI